ncbi:MAG: hypothetical protein D4R88_04490 [Methanosarcinales archaeon]|nr:MAG: hypothetical protein D4R88_04490 [Methanosarcinales archaeon]
MFFAHIIIPAPSLMTFQDLIICMIILGLIATSYIIHTAIKLIDLEQTNLLTILNNFTALLMTPNN